MNTAILLTGDTKLASQIEQWVKLHMEETLRVESYANLQAFSEKLDLARGDPAQAAEGEEDLILKLFIVDADLIPAQPEAWLANLQKLTQEKAPKLVSKGLPSVLVMAHEGGATKPEIFHIAAIDDLILKPMDKSLMMQKIEFLTSEDPKVNPSFLFRAKTLQYIEIGRGVTIEELSEFGIGIRSPKPLDDGTFAAIHSDTFGAKAAKRIICRSYESVPHKTKTGEFVTRFAFFGLSQEQLSNLRRHIVTHLDKTPAKPPSAPLTVVSPTTGKGIPKELLAKIAGFKVGKFAIVDLNPNTMAATKEVLESSFKLIPLRTFSSYSRLVAELRKLLPSPTPAAKPADSPTVPAEPAAAQAPSPPADPNADATIDIPIPTIIDPEETRPIPAAFPRGPSLGAILRGGSYDLSDFDPALKPGEEVLGRRVSEWLEKPEQWMSTVHPEDRDAYFEFLSFVEAGNPARVSIRKKDGEENLKFFDVSGRLEKEGEGGSSALIRLDMTEIEEDEWKNLNTESPADAGPSIDKSAFRFEGIIIDGAFLRPDPKTWYENFVSLLRETKVLGPEDKPPRVFVISDAKAITNLDAFKIKDIIALDFRPLDRRHVAQQFRALFPALTPSTPPEKPMFFPCVIPATIARDVVMEEISEYGLVIQYPQAIAQKTLMPLYSRLFANEWVWARCHSSEKVGEGTTHRCQFMFFGPSDALLQPIRRWVREDYVAQKNASDEE